MRLQIAHPPLPASESLLLVLALACLSWLLVGCSDGPAGSSGEPLVGATVAISGAAHAAISGLDGSYGLDLPLFPEPQAITVSHTSLLAPPPFHDVLFGEEDMIKSTCAVKGGYGKR